MIGAAAQAQAATVGAATNAAHAAQGVAGSALGKVGSLDATRVATDNAEWLRTQTAAAAAQGVDFAQEQANRLQRTTAEFKEFMEVWMKRKIHKRVEMVVDSIPGIMKSSTDDPDMPNIVKRGKDRAVDKVWPDLKEEIMWQVTVAMDATDISEGELGSGPDCVRAFLRYHIYPNDKTIWGKIKDPVWIVFTCCSLVPVAAATPIIFLCIFLIIDKTDTFQLMSFILQFKGTQFISHGIIRCIVGFFQFINCVTVPAKVDGHNCSESGPGVTASYPVVAVGWLLQIVLIWCALALMRCSKEKGKKKLKGDIDAGHAAQSAKRAGGYIRNFLVYDMAVFLGCVGVMAYVITSRPEIEYDHWVVQQTFFACQIVYGFSSIPFFLFTLPLLQSILTHTVPTAYDYKGRACAVVGPPRPRPEGGQSMMDLLPMEEAQELFGQMQAVAMGRLRGKEAAASM